ncbi:MAG: kinase/pyrophosphorylase [Kofleriaceae bacterium]|nr:kinase/pyrophosphorylase [Myxococcales bacterium]MCB9561428.1 kinase/pyrophosphorylase [Kofleriaceae bacterium]MCB9573482.1 kinase/pyrophosphorylase [Kofleriaceae bacterium]
MIISDATGETAERMVRAATLQFSNTPVNVRTYSRVRLEAECEKLIEKAAELRALVVFTVVNPEERDLISRLVERYNVEAVDLIGALIGKLASFLGSTPAGVPGLLHTITEDYFRRIEAVEFAVKNDDGAEPRNLPKADLVLVGISRTSKTPLSTYLAQRGLKVANVPLVLGIDPPEELAQVDERKVFGLIIQPDTLMKIRQARLQYLGMPADTSYGEKAHIANEIAYSREIFRKHSNWPVIDVTARAIEETASDILRIYQERMAS